MNLEKLRDVADVIKASPDNYSQHHWGTGGDPPQCVAGWLITLANRWNDVRLMAEDSAEYSIASDELDVREEMTYRLFGPSWPGLWKERAGIKVNNALWFFPTASDAATILRAMADDNELWPEDRY